ncbi:MAG: glycosyltransferase [Actinomycetota bacterium]|nr:glycosyltransferase [Actinomycetota bacterium]
MALRQREARQMDGRFLEAVAQLSPEAVLVLKGRNLGREAVHRVRESGVPVTIYYPDNPFWAAGDTGDPLSRLAEADLAIIWSERLAGLLRPRARRVEVVPFGFDSRWYPLSPPGSRREGVAFIGTWSMRRERFLSALRGLPLTVHGLGWDRARIGGGPPLTEAAAGHVLRHALVGVNLLHPQNAGAHNMRTREIAASGAVEVTEPGTDGTPLRDGESCAWFRTPEELREAVLSFLDRPEKAVAVASHGQALVAPDTYVRRGELIARLIGDVIAPRRSPVTAP